MKVGSIRLPGSTLYGQVHLDNGGSNASSVGTLRMRRATQGRPVTICTAWLGRAMGFGANSSGSKQSEAFSLHVSNDAIVDLRDRIARTRFPDQTPGTPWAYGTDVAWMRELIAYWHDRFDWRAQEARLNAFRNTRCLCMRSYCISCTYGQRTQPLSFAVIARLAGVGIRVP